MIKVFEMFSGYGGANVSLFIVGVKWVLFDNCGDEE